MLLARRASNQVITSISSPGVWSFPGGKVDAGESPTEAALREAKEELGGLPTYTETGIVIEEHYDGTYHIEGKKGKFIYNTVVFAVTPKEADTFKP